MAVEKFEEIAALFDPLVRKIGWIATGRQTRKTKHLAKDPDVALPYWTPEPVGYDPNLFRREGVGDPTHGVLKLPPRRIELWNGSDMATGKPQTLWKA